MGVIEKEQGFRSKSLKFLFHKILCQMAYLAALKSIHRPEYGGLTKTTICVKMGKIDIKLGQNASNLCILVVEVKHMPKVTQAISNLFQTCCDRNSCNNPDILQKYSSVMEVQVNVAADDGEIVAEFRNTWELDGDRWHHIRIPKGAMTQHPYWNDYELQWSIAEHAEAIGMTGWDWASKKSRWVAFDFDSLTGHAKGVGVSDETLQEIQDAATDIKWVETRLSTRGGGLHLYVYFCDDGITTNNHTEHAALARCVLGMMSKHAGFNFAAAIDCCGGNMWVWHRDATSQNRGLAIIKEAHESLHEKDLPENWIDNVDVITRKRTKVRVRGINDSEQDKFDTLANSRPPIVMTDQHNALLDDLQESGFSALWHADYNLIQTHTMALKKVSENHPGKYEGPFETLSSGSDPGKPNCFLFPMPGRGWKVFRFGRGVHEHNTWEIGENGWTYTFFDRRPSFDTACRIAEGAEIDGGGYSFSTLQQAAEALNYLEYQIDINLERYGHRKAFLKKGRKDGRLLLRMNAEKSEQEPGFGWVERRGWWEKILRGIVSSENDHGVGVEQWDSTVRNVKTSAQEEAGWFVHDKSDEWVRHPMTNVTKYLSAPPHSLSRHELDNVLGQAVGNSWKLVNLPFQDEYPGKRQWNFMAAQWRYTPVDLDYDECPEHPHWDMVLNHIGTDLNKALKHHKWAKKWNITTGRQYLQMWIASLLRVPFDKLPYLFLYGPENSGKSTLHIAISKLMTGGVASADRALTNTNDFNGELANAVLAVVEETDVRGDGGKRAKNRMKDWSVNDTISIRKMRTDVYNQRNTLHFIQCSQERESCLVSFGDTRTTMIYVAAFLENPEVPKAILLEKLDEEAPHFMRTLFDIDIPPAEGRLRIPFINTASKDRFEELMRNDLDAFLQDRCSYVPGEIIPLKDFFNTFIKTVPDTEVGNWSTRRVARRMPDKYPTGAMGHKNIVHIGNIVLDADINRKFNMDKKPCTRVNTRLQVGSEK